MSMVLACPACGAPVTSDGKPVGEKIRCDCGMVFTVSPIFAAPPATGAAPRAVVASPGLSRLRSGAGGGREVRSGDHAARELFTGAGSKERTRTGLAVVARRPHRAAHQPYNSSHAGGGGGGGA